MRACVCCTWLSTQDACLKHIQRCRGQVLDLRKADGFAQLTPDLCFRILEAVMR